MVIDLSGWCLWHNVTWEIASFLHTLKVAFYVVNAMIILGEQLY